MIVAHTQAKSDNTLPGLEIHVSIRDRDECGRVLGLEVWISHGSLIPCRKYYLVLRGSLLASYLA